MGSTSYRDTGMSKLSKVRVQGVMTQLLILVPTTVSACCFHCCLIKDAVFSGENAVPPVAGDTMLTHKKCEIILKYCRRREKQEQESL